MRRIWKLIRDSKGYMVSNFGETRNGQGKTLLSRIGSNRRGRIIFVYNSEGKLTSRSLAVVVLEAFTGDRPMGYVPKFRDGNLANYKASNLEWQKRVGKVEPDFGKAETLWTDVRESYMLQDAGPVNELIEAFNKLARLYDTDLVTISYIHFGRYHGWRSWYLREIKPNL